MDISVKHIAMTHLQGLISSDDSKFNILSSWLDNLEQSKYCQCQMIINKQ